MFADRVETKWIEAFKNQFALCGVQPGDPVAILSESQSRQVNVHLSELALGLLGARIFHLTVPTSPQNAPVPVRSTGQLYAQPFSEGNQAAAGKMPCATTATRHGEGWLVNGRKIFASFSMDSLLSETGTHWECVVQYHAPCSCRTCLCRMN